MAYDVYITTIPIYTSTPIMKLLNSKMRNQEIFTGSEALLVHFLDML